jgi:hypothetical protein
MINVYFASKTKHKWMWRVLVTELQIPSTITWPSISDMQAHTELTPDDKESLASVCVEEASNCDLFLLFIPDEDRGKHKGTLIELGAALANNVPVIAFGEFDDIFGNHPNIYTTHSLQDFIWQIKLALNPRSGDQEK